MAANTIDGKQDRHFGWETALSEYRLVESREKAKAESYFKGLWYGLSRTMLFRTTHKYWSINFYTFTGLSVACLVLAYVHMGRSVSFGIFATLVSVSAVHNLSVVGRLTGGSYSYEECFKRWTGVFEALDHDRATKNLGEATVPPPLEPSTPVPPPNSLD